VVTQICIGLLERERRRQGLTGTALARKMGVSRSSVSEVERGVRVPSDAFKEKAAQALEVPIARLFPAWYFLRARESIGIQLAGDRSGKLVAFANRVKADTAAAALGEYEVAGPASPGFFACVLGAHQEQVEALLLIDPAVECLTRQLAVVD